MKNKLKRPFAKIILENDEKKVVPSKEIYDSKDKIEIKCIYCDARLRINKKAQTYYFSANDLNEHSEECKGVNDILEINEDYLNIKTDDEIDSLNGLVNSINYFFRKKKSEKKSEKRTDNSIVKQGNKEKYYEIKSLNQLKEDIKNEGIDLNKNYKFIMKIKNIKLNNGYFYINGVEDISIAIGDQYGINQGNIENLRKYSSEYGTKNYVFCLGKIIKIKDKLQIKAKDTKLEYIFIDKNNIRKLFH